MDLPTRDWIKNELMSYRADHPMSLIARWFMDNPKLRIERHGAGGEIMDCLDTFGGRVRYVGRKFELRENSKRIVTAEQIVCAVNEEAGYEAVKMQDLYDFIRANPTTPRTHYKP